MKNFYVFSNLAISIDGKSSTKDREHINASPVDFALMNHHRSRADAILYGATTLRAFKYPAIIKQRKFLNLRKKKKLPAQPINVVMAKNVDFDLSWPFFTADIKRVLVVPRHTSDEILRPYLNHCQIFKYEERADFPEQIMRYLKSQGVKNLLLEGGGGVMFPWVERDLIDEWNVTISPCVIGGENAPTMVEGEGFNADRVKRYRLKKCVKKKDELFLQYVRL